MIKISYQAFSLSGLGFASRASAICQGLDMGLSDFMIEGWIKFSAFLANNYFVTKRDGEIRYFLRIDINKVTAHMKDGTNRADLDSSETYNDGGWHYVVLLVDRSDASGFKLYMDNVMVDSDDPTSVGSLDNGGDFFIGSYAGGILPFAGLLDNWLIWNFGLNGLPADYADYILWRFQGRHRFLPLSEYNGGSWNGYADADRIERITYGALDDDNGDFEGAGADGTDVSTNTDWVKYQTAAEIDNEAGSGVNSYNGSTFCCKIHTASGDNPSMYITGANFDAAFTVGEWCELSFDYKTLNCTNARLYLQNTATAHTLILQSLASVAWTTVKGVFQVTPDNDMSIQIYSHYAAGQSGNEVVWVDKIRIHRIGNVAHWKFENNLLDEVGQNDLTAGGTGNLYPTYSLKREKIILAGAVNPAMGDRR